MTYLSSTFPIWLLPFVERLARGSVYAPLTAPDGWRDAMHLPNGLGLLAGLLVAVAVVWMWGRWSPPPEGAFGKLRGASQRTAMPSSTNFRPGILKTTR